VVPGVVETELLDRTGEGGIEGVGDRVELAGVDAGVLQTPPTDSSGSSQVENGTGRLPCLRRLKRSSSAAATVRPSITSAAAGSWNTALIPSTFTWSSPPRGSPDAERGVVPTPTRGQTLKAREDIGASTVETGWLGNSGDMFVSVLGTGYLGATHAACLSACGHRVHGVDVDPARIALLREGRAPFHEPGLDALLAEGVSSGRLTFGTELAEAADADVHFVCVGTPQSDDDSAGADLRYLWQVAEELAPHLERWVPAGRQVHRSGRHRGAAARAGAGPGAGGQRRRGRLEPRVPA
jgi:hypothetical protein